MNISKINIQKLLFPLLLLVLPLWSAAQVEYFEVLVNESVIHEFISCPNAGQVTQISSNGTHELNDVPGGTYGIASCGNNANPNVLEYFPNLDFLGLDTMEISYWDDDPFPSPVTVLLVFDVVPAIVTAVDDYITISPDSTVIIDVLANDESNLDTLLLSNIPLVNHGTAEITSSGKISFTPSNGYEGIAQFNYTVCDDEYEICDVAIVTVFVQNDIAVNDSIILVTQKNKSILALLSLDNGYQELLEPLNGSLEVVDGGLEYTPDVDYVGLDTFSYAYNTNSNTSIATFIIDVLWAEDPNDYAVDDYTFTSINSNVSLNVLDNDLNDNLFIQGFEQPEFGVVVHNGSGDFTYTPDDEFEGLDQFTYTAFISGAPGEEDATVYIVVSNQKPESQDYELLTPMNVPLILNYDIPITNYEFAITGNGVYGDVVFYPGEFSEYEDDNGNPLLVNGQEVDGYNLVIYYPNEPDYLGWDEFEINYCVGGDCQLVKVDIEMVEIEQPQADTLCVGDCVWAGDANYDGKADMTDLLPVGYCIGEVGDERTNGGIDWYGQYSDNWEGSIGNTPTNLKHVDTNGDGFIGVEDTVALSQFYGKYHDLTSEANPPYVDVPLFFVPLTPNPGPGDLVLVDIVLGTPALPAIDMYGLTFALNFDGDNIDPGTMEVNFYDGNWMAYNSTMLSMVKEPWLGRVEAGYTRANGISANGYGIIGQVSFVVIDDIDGNRLVDNNVFKTTVRAEVPITMNSAGRFVSISAEGFDLYITKPKKEDLNEQLIVYPNPSSDLVNIHLNGDNLIEQIVIYSLTGQEVYRMDNIYDKQAQFNITSQFANGMYIISAVTEKGVINEKVEILR
jgi:Bacterial Ig domain/Secretion system C-terminal sorting domain